MIYKETLFAGYDEQGSHIYPLEMYEHSMIKAAAELHPEIDRYIRNAKPIPGKNILLIDALGAGEWWGANLRGDYFQESELDQEDPEVGYKSFMLYAYPYIEHQNEGRIKDPRRRYGEKVQLAVYFKPMHRVQLIVIVDAHKDPIKDIVSQIDAGRHPDVSMACHVAYDKCSICGSIHRTRADYCVHARNQLNQILPDGRKVFLYNYRPKFHDISFVFVGADRSAKVLQKIANAFSEPQPDPVYQRTIEFSNGLLIPHYTTKKAGAKKATIEKQVPLEQAAVVPVTKNGKKLSLKSIKAKLNKVKQQLEKEKKFSPSIMKKMAKLASFEDILYTGIKNGIFFKPEEFQYLYLLKQGNEEYADKLWRERKIFSMNVKGEEPADFLKEASYNSYVAIYMNMYAYDRAADQFEDRMPELEKKSSIFNIPSVQSIAWPTLSGLYRAYGKAVPRILKATEFINEKIAPVTAAIAKGTAWAVGQHMANQAWRTTRSPYAIPEDADIEISMTGNEIIKFGSYEPSYNELYFAAAIEKYINRL